MSESIPNNQDSITTVRIKAEEQLGSGSFHLAERLFNEIISQCPKDVHAFGRLDEIYSLTSNLSQQTKARKSFLSAGGDVCAYHLAVGKAHDRAQRPLRALRSFRRARTSDPNNPEAAIKLFLCAELLDLVDEAFEAATDAFRLTSAAWLRYRRATLLFKLARVEEASSELYLAMLDLSGVLSYEKETFDLSINKISNTRDWMGDVDKEFFLVWCHSLQGIGEEIVLAMFASDLCRAGVLPQGRFRFFCSARIAPILVSLFPDISPTPREDWRTHFTVTRPRALIVRIERTRCRGREVGR